MSPRDRNALEDAVRKLESTSLAIAVANRIGSPLQKIVTMLPERSQALIQRATHRAMGKCLDAALSTIHLNGRGPAANGFHKAACWASGAVGGSFGVAALAAELPVSTTIMLRSIADIGRAEGEDLTDPAARLACLEVFALGGRNPADDSADVGYYAVRAALARAIREAAAYIAERGFAETGAPAMVRLVSAIAARFGVTVSEKAALQAVPVVGAVTGSTINWIFIEHFQRMAQGHFTIRRLERTYGPERVREEYERLRSGNIS
jgi:hypothetical protein